MHFGADDFGGTLEEENVHASANFVHTTTVHETVDLIRESGFMPAERTTLYDIIAEYNAGEYPKYEIDSARLHQHVDADTVMPTIPSELLTVA